MSIPQHILDSNLRNIRSALQARGVNVESAQTLADLIEGSDIPKWIMRNGHRVRINMNGKAHPNTLRMLQASKGFQLSKSAQPKITPHETFNRHG